MADRWFARQCLDVLRALARTKSTMIPTMAATQTSPMSAASANPMDRSRASCVSSQAGFTLLELTLVIAIVAVLMGLAIPRLRDTGTTELRSQSHRLAMTFKL